MTQIPYNARVAALVVAKTHLDLHLLPEGRALRLPYTPEALAGLIEMLLARSTTIVVMEASGGYERPCADALAAAGLPVAVINPRQARRFAGALGKLTKTDRIDAAMLAAYGERMRPEPRYPADPARTRLAACVTRRRQLVSMAATERQRIDPAHLDPDIRADILRHVAMLDAEILAIDAIIAGLIASHPD